MDPQQAESGFDAMQKCLTDALLLADQLEDAATKESLQRQVAEIRPLIAQLQALRDAGKVRGIKNSLVMVSLCRLIAPCRV